MSFLIAILTVGCASAGNLISSDVPLRFVGEYSASPEVLYRATEEAFRSEGFGIESRDKENLRLVANQGLTFALFQSGTWGRYILAVIQPSGSEKARLMIATRQKLKVEPSLDTVDRKIEAAVSKRIRILRSVGEI